MGISARKVNNYDLYSGHAWYVPGIKGMFGFIGWFILGAILGGIVTLIMGLFMSQQALADYSMIVVYPLQFLPAMVYAANQSRKNMIFDAGYTLDNRHFSPYSFALIILVTVVMTFASMFVFDLPNYWNMQLTNRSSLLSQFYDMMMEVMKQMTGGPFWSSFLVVAIFAPIFEEWLCRGMVLRGLLTKMKPTGSLILTMIIHFVNNGTAVVLSNVESLKDYDYWIDILGKQQYTLVFIASCVVLAACIAVFSRIKVENPWGNIDRIPPADETVAAEQSGEAQA